MENSNTTTEIPEYFRMETFRREEFLAQIGSFTQVQYQLFHNICDFWNPVLDYNHFILKSSKSFLASNNQLELLMGKLKAAHLGLLQYRLVDGEIKAGRIILSEKDAMPFYYYLAEDLMARQIHDNNHPFLTIKAFEDDGISLPTDLITPLESSMLSPGFAERGGGLKIIGINRKMKSPILLPSGMMADFVGALIGHIRMETASPNLVENLSRITGQKISEIQKNLTKKEPDFWISICQKLIEHKEDLKLRLKGLNPLFFTSCQLLQTYFQNSITEMKEQLQEDQEKQKAHQDIIREFKEKESAWTHISVLDDKLKSCEERWEGFREEFKQRSLIRGEGKEQPDLIVVNNMVIHKDFLFKYFTREISTLRNNFLYMYQSQMTDLLRHNKTDRYTQFFSKNNFRADIMANIRERDLQLWELLQKPTRVAESAYHFLQNVSSSKKSSHLKDAMGIYFQSDLKNFRNIDSILQLKLMSLFEKSYKELGWWARFVLRITGRYDSYISMFTDTPRDAAGRNRNPAEPRGPQGVMSFDENRISAERNLKRHKKKDYAYSPRDKRKAWAEFDEAIRKKK